MYVLITYIIAASGALFGFFLKGAAKEEIKFGKYGFKYFVWMKRILLISLMGILAHYTELSTLTIMGGVVGLVGGFFVSPYLFLGCAMSVSSLLSKNSTMIVSSITFLYGLPYGSMIRKIKKEHIVTIILFFLPLLVLTTEIPTQLILGAAVGGCVPHIIK